MISKGFMSYSSLVEFQSTRWSLRRSVGRSAKHLQVLRGACTLRFDSIICEVGVGMPEKQLTDNNPRLPHSSAHYG